MDDETKTFALTSCAAGAEDPVLCGLRADGRLDGLLFELTLRQTYRNTSERTLEVVYTFPLPSQAVLLGFATELNGVRQVGTMVAQRAAERRYEQALSSGDAPVMLESLGGGLHTANIGNLKPGDELVLEIRFAQVLAFEQGRLRLAIPTTIAPRFGHPKTGLQPQQVPQASLLMEQALSVSVTIAGTLANASIDCPTHRVVRKAVDDGVRLDLAHGAWLDRDVVIVVDPKEPMQSLVLRAADTVAPSAPAVVMAALQPMLPALRGSIALKLLVDCSSSMAGDSIASAKAAVNGVLARLTEVDHVSLTCFGTHVRHLLKPTTCSQATLSYLKIDVDAIDANLGGTEMAAALQAVFGLRQPKACESADVLLLTDGEVWQAEEMIAAAKASGHRVFAIGVGSAPAEGVLRSLAEATGGACEFATPGEALEAAAGRMLSRIRQQPWRNPRIDWGGEPVWQSMLPANVFGGDTVIAFAGMPAAADATSVRLLALDAQDVPVDIAQGAPATASADDTLARIAAAHRITALDRPQAQQLAIDYQLLTKHTNCILVHERAEADKATELAELHRVSSMLAAGWGATSTVLHSRMQSYGSLSTPSVWRTNRAQAGISLNALLSHSMDEVEIPAFLRKQNDEDAPVSLQDMVTAVSDYLDRSTVVLGLAAHCDRLALHAQARRAIGEAVAVGLTRDEAWLTLAYWASTHTGPQRCTMSADTQTALQRLVDQIDAAQRTQCLAVFDQILGGYASSSWTETRTERLLQAMGRSS
jgi:Ca-activated chloride channel family protein